MAKSYNSKNGVFYTPAELAEYLIEPLITGTEIKIFDPSYGKGALLLAAEKTLLKKYGTSSKNFYGCDINPKNGYLKHLPNSNFSKNDFFEFRSDILFDSIVMNPPYVRHHLINKKKQEKYYNEIRDILKIKRSSDLWVYFLLKATKHLKEKGNLAAILPWSFLQSDYARDIKEYLVKKFNKIKVLALGKDFFDNATERIIMLWLFGYNVDNKEIKIGYSQHIDKDISYLKIENELWLGNTNSFKKAEAISQEYKNYGFESFKNYADVKIGIVTGADKYFLYEGENKNKKLPKLKESELINILNSSRQLCSLDVDNVKVNKYLMLINEQNSHKFQDYLDIGKKEKIHLRAHCKLRSLWYSVKTGEYPDGFFPYRVSNFPFLVLNNRGYQCTNSIHRIYFKNNVNKIQKRVIQLSFLTYFSQFSIENNAKIYGSGVLKIEPKSLYGCLVCCDETVYDEKVYKLAGEMLSSGTKEKLLDTITSHFCEKLAIPKKFSAQMKEEYYRIRDRRLNR